MIHNNMKQEIDELNKVVRVRTNTNYQISFADVILFLIREYKKSSSMVLSKKTLVEKSREKNNNVSRKNLTRFKNENSKSDVFWKNRRSTCQFN